jgi:hypothetical protein
MMKTVAIFALIFAALASSELCGLQEYDPETVSFSRLGDCKLSGLIFSSISASTATISAQSSMARPTGGVEELEASATQNLRICTFSMTQAKSLHVLTHDPSDAESLIISSTDSSKSPLLSNS